MSLTIMCKPGNAVIQDLSFEISHRLEAVIKFSCRCILQHHRSPFIIQVGNSKCIGAEVIEEGFLYPDIFIKGFVIVEVIMGDIAEDGPCKMQAVDPVLVNGMAAAFHEYMAASFIHISCKSLFRLTASGVVWVDGISLSPIMFFTVETNPQT